MSVTKRLVYGQSEVCALLVGIVIGCMLTVFTLALVASLVGMKGN